MEPVLNERSLESSGAPTSDRVKSLLAVLWRLDKLGFPKVLRHVRDAKNIEVEQGTTLHAWLFQKAPRDLRQALAGRMDKAPFVEDLHEREEVTRGSLLQAAYDGAEARGAGVAYLRDAPAVALYGLPRWEVDPLAILLSRMDEEEQRLVEQTVHVIHLCRPEQVPAREKVLRERVLRAVTSGDDLWQRRGELFPRLDFCAVVERQLRALSGKEFYFQQVVLAFSRLDAALGEWAAGPLHPGMDSSPETTMTLAHGAYGPMRDFPCPDGSTRQFSNHLKLFSNNWRIYYWETRSVDAGGRAFIGYVGAHLPTVRYRT
jgi:hypothetical protein